MLNSITNLVGITSKNIPQYLPIYQDKNQIGNQGCEHIAKAKWPSLQVMWLGMSVITKDSNKIEEEGCQTLSKQRWSSLEEINLGTEDLIKKKIPLEKEDMRSSANRSTKFYAINNSNKNDQSYFIPVLTSVI